MGIWLAETSGTLLKRPVTPLDFPTQPHGTTRIHPWETAVTGAGDIDRRHFCGRGRAGDIDRSSRNHQGNGAVTGGSSYFHQDHSSSMRFDGASWRRI